MTGFVSKATAPTSNERKVVNLTIKRAKERFGVIGWRMLGEDLQRAVVRAEVLGTIAGGAAFEDTAAGRMAQLGMEWEPEFR